MKKNLIILLAALCMALCACQHGNVDDHSVVTNPSGTPDAIINGQPIYYLTDEDKQAWEEPIAKLLANVIPMFDGRSRDEAKSSYDPNSPAVPPYLACGLLDITRDGCPELLVEPVGAYGSSGTSTYYIYDIPTGKHLGEIGGGIDELFAEYYNIRTGEFYLLGQYWLRYGWEERDRYIVTPGYSDELDGYYLSTVFRVYHKIASKEVEREDEDPNDMYYTAIWEEWYPETKYFAYGQETTLDDYYTAYDEFMHTYVQIPETKLQMLSYSDVCDDGDNSMERASKMAQSLLKSGQKFINRSRQAPVDSLKGGQPS